MMTKRDDGGPAFPPNAGWRDLDPSYWGASLRDVFAWQALIAIYAGIPDAVASASFMAERAYQLADAMLAERSKP